MKKRILALLLAVVLGCAPLAACSSDPSDGFYEYDSFLEYISLPNPDEVISIEETEIEDAIMNAFFALFSDSSDYKEEEASATDVIQTGDKVTISYVGTIDGVKVDSATATNQSLTIGSDSYIDGFEDGLKGFKKGDVVVLNLKFPEDYGKEDLNGKNVRFEVTISKIMRMNYPPFEDKTIEDYTDHKTVAEFKAAAREDAIKNLAWSDFAEDCKVSEYPKTELKYYYDLIIDNYEQNAALIGQIYGTYMTLEDYVTQQMGYSTIDQFYQYVLSQAKSYVKLELAILGAAEKFGLVINDRVTLEREMHKLYEEHKETDGHDHGYDDYVDERGGAKFLEIDVYENFVKEYLVGKASIVDDTKKDGFVGNNKGNVLFYENGNPKTGWFEFDADGDGTKELYYFDTETGFANENKAALVPTQADSTVKQYMYFTENGKFVRVCGADGKAEIVSDGTGLLYIVNGKAESGLKEFDYHSDIEGNEKYWFDPSNDGYMATGLTKLDSTFGVHADKYYNFGNSGIYDPDRAIENLATIDPANSGFMTDGIHSEKVGDDTQFTIYVDSKLQIGKVVYNNKTYFTNEKGIVIIGTLHTYENKQYYCTDTGDIQIGGTRTIDGKVYTFDATDGHVINVADAQ